MESNVELENKLYNRLRLNACDVDFSQLIKMQEDGDSVDEIIDWLIEKYDLIEC